MKGDVLQFLADPENRKVFDVVARSRSIRLAALLESLGVKTEDAAKLNEVRARLDGLKQNGLVAEEAASLKEFAVLYITADGLEAERKVRRLALK